MEIIKKFESTFSKEIMCLQCQYVISFDVTDIIKNKDGKYQAMCPCCQKTLILDIDEKDFCQGDKYIIEKNTTQYYKPHYHDWR